MPQVEARLRQLEGRALASDAAQAKPLVQPQKYDKERVANGGVLTSAGGYNADADVAAVADGKKKKKKDKEAAAAAGEEGGEAKKEKKKKKRDKEMNGDAAAAAADGEPVKKKKKKVKDA